MVEHNEQKLLEIELEILRDSLAFALSALINVDEHFKTDLYKTWKKRAKQNSVEIYKEHEIKEAECRCEIAYRCWYKNETECLKCGKIRKYRKNGNA
jgi:hypothetical protein